MSHPPDDVATLLDDLRDSWARGERPTIEQYLARVPNLALDSEALLDLIYQEIDLRDRHGEPAALDDYLRRFPKLADELRRLFEVHDALDDDALLGELPDAETPEEFPRIDGYEIRERLGSGTFGVVYRAWQPSLRRDVALKVLRDGAAADLDDKASLRREAQAVARLRHPNIVQVYEVGEHAGCPFFALEYVAGGSLDQLLNHEPQPPRESACLVETLARAVHYAHQRNLIHCDLKPANVLLQRKSEISNLKSQISNLKSVVDFDPKITDFGLARKFDASTGMFSGTATGVRAGQGGTLSYMAPEQAGGPDAPIGPAADVHALGAILYEMLTGRPPFIDRSLLELVMQLRDRDPVPPRSLIPATPRDLETICLQCLHKDPLTRYASAADLADDLHRFEAGEPIRARPLGAVGRAWRWSWRNPVVAGLIGGLIVTVIGGFSGVTAKMVEAQNERDAKETARQGEANAHRAEKNRADELEIALHRNRLLLAFRAYRDLDVVAANRALDACKPELRDVEWYALKHLCRGPRQSFACGDPIDLVLSGDGRRAAVLEIGPERAVRVLDLNTGKVVFTAPGRRVAALSADGKLLALAGDGEQGLTVWDVDRGATLWSRPKSAFKDDIVAVAFLDQGAMVLTGTEGLRNGDPPHGLEFQLWETRSGEPLTDYPGPRRAAGTHVNLSPDGTRLAWMSSVDTRFGAATEVVLTDTLKGKRLGVLTVRARSVERTAFSPDNHWAATSSRDGTVKLWDLRDPDAVREWGTLNGTTQSVLALAFSRDGKTLATAGRDRGIRLWDVAHGELIAVLRGHADAVWGLAFLPDDNGLVSVGEDGRLKVWDRDAPGTFVVHSADDATNAGVFLPDGTLVTAHTRTVVVDNQYHNTGRLQFIDPNGRKKVRENRGWYQYLIATSDGQRLASFDSQGVSVWNTESGEPLATLPHGVGGPLAFGPLGKLVVGVLREKRYNTLIVADAATGTERSRLEAPEWVRCLAATPDGSRVVAGCQDGSVLVFDPVAAQALASFSTGHKGGVLALAVRPDGQEILTAGPEERTASVRDAATGKERFQLTGHTGRINAMAYSADGRRILTGSEDRTVKLWDAATGEELVTFLDCTKPVRWVAFSADGKHLAAGGSAANGIPGSEVIVWDAQPLDAPR